MVDTYIKHLKKRHGITQKRIDLETILRDYEVNVNELTDNGGRGLIHLLISEESVEELELVLSLPKEGYKTKVRPDLNLIDQKLLWTPMVAAIN